MEFSLHPKYFHFYAVHITVTINHPHVQARQARNPWKSQAFSFIVISRSYPLHLMPNVGPLLRKSIGGFEPLPPCNAYLLFPELFRLNQENY